MKNIGHTLEALVEISADNTVYFVVNIENMFIVL